MKNFKIYLSGLVGIFMLFSLACANELFIIKSGVYTISGNEYSNLVVNVDSSKDMGEVVIKLNNATLSSNTLTPLNIINASSITIELEKDTKNVIHQRELLKNTKDSSNAALYSNVDLKIVGEGSLLVNSAYKDGIYSEKNIEINGGNIIVEAEEEGITSKNSINVSNSSINITANKDALKTNSKKDEENGNIILEQSTLYLQSKSDAISADKELIINGGDYTISQSKKGIKASTFVVENGNITISSSKNGIDVKNSFVMQAGELTLTSGEKALFAKNNVILNGGSLQIINAFEGIESANITINNGILNLTTIEDGININDEKGAITIVNGEIFMVAGGDGIDSNGNFVMSGGKLAINQLGLLKKSDKPVDITGKITITGGEITNEKGTPLIIR